MSVYTKTGDKGMTGLLTGERIEKDSLRVEAYGTIDEFNAALGMSRSTCKNEFVLAEIYKLQKMNMLLMADLASLGQSYIKPEHITALEQIIDQIEDQLPPLNSFIVPGDTQGGAALDLARTVARRAERYALQLSKIEQVNPDVLIILNRLSDLCFVLMRLEQQSMSSL